ncbi:coth protein-domain-containing protein [Zychaea mexicana]|uniref:coth protein-domain-containing protein n=1 Tax=Zychaea mexicana TaxID=64656 RepID=UPI0022FF0DC6|nr:coth protein-domain-containing protein [Zychaea mexicana]KAI9489624.1 coth protein-domain-containing protein [Zychaea mexicana]
MVLLIIAFLASFSATFLQAFLAVDAKQEVEYRVISPFTGQDHHTLAVVVDDKSYPLIRSSVSQLVHVGTAPASSRDDGYYYAKIKDNVIVEEEYMRRFTGIVDTTTPYQFYNRSRDYWDITPLPQVLDPLSAIHRIESELHVSGEIATIHVMGNQTEIDYMHTNVLEDYQLKTDMVYIRGNDIQTFKDVEFELGGRSSRRNPKVSYNFKIAKGGNTLHGYRRFKLRSLYNDPSNIREALAYGAIESAGLASSHFSYARVFINNQTAGFFGLIENFKNPWYRNEFGNGSKKEYSQGTAYQGNGGSGYFGSVPKKHMSDLSYYPDNITAYSDGQYKIKEDPSEGKTNYQHLMELTKFISEAPTETDDAVRQWEEHLDMDSVLRSMALEVLLGYSDGYSTSAENYFVYQEAADSKRFIYMPWDLDLTFGDTRVKLSDLLTGDYRDFPGMVVRPLTSQFLRVDEFRERFDTLLKVLTEKLVNLHVMGPFIDDTVAMVREDVEWDNSLARLSRFNSSSNHKPSPNDIVPWPLDRETMYDRLFVRDKLNITFDKAVTGPTGSISLCGVKEILSVFT